MKRAATAKSVREDVADAIGAVAVVRAPRKTRLVATSEMTAATRIVTRTAATSATRRNAETSRSVGDDGVGPSGPSVPIVLIVLIDPNVLSAVTRPVSRLGKIARIVGVPAPVPAEVAAAGMKSRPPARSKPERPRSRPAPDRTTAGMGDSLSATSVVTAARDAVAAAAGGTRARRTAPRAWKARPRRTRMSGPEVPGARPRGARLPGTKPGMTPGKISRKIHPVTSTATIQRLNPGKCLGAPKWKET